MRLTTKKHGFSAIPLPVEASANQLVPGVWTLGLLFLAGTLLAALGYTATVYFVNPVRDFTGNAPFPAVRSDYRSEKIALFNAFASAGPIEGIVLGSSRSMLLNGARMRQLADRKRFFNFALASAKGEDFLAALRYTFSRGQRPTRVVIGVDVESLRDARAHGDSIHPLRELAVGPSDLWTKTRTFTRRVFAWSYAQDTAQSIYLRVTPRMAAVGFLPDGTLQYLRRERQRSEGTFQLETEMAGCIAGSRKKIEDTSELSAAQIRYLKQTIAEARAAGAVVTLWLTGPHPRAVEHMSAGTAYPHLVTETWGLLRELDSGAFNFHDPKSYGGPSYGYYDCNHFDNSHARIIERVLIGGQNPVDSLDVQASSEPADGERRHYRLHDTAGGGR